MIEMDKDILYKIMENMLEIDFRIASLTSVTEHIMQSFKANEDEENERLYYCIYLVLSALEKDMQDNINMVDEYIVHEDFE